MFVIKKQRFIFGIDDGSGVVNCIMWPDKGDRKDDKKTRDSMKREIAFFFDTKIKVGEQISIIGALEYYNGEIQMNVHKISLLADQRQELFSEVSHTTLMHEDMFGKLMGDFKRDCYFSALQAINIDDA